MSQPDLRCGMVIDEHDEEVCNHIAVTEVLVRNAFALYSVPLCARHATEHRSFYEQRKRTSRQRSNRNSKRPERDMLRSTPHQGDTHEHTVAA